MKSKLNLMLLTLAASGSAMAHPGHAEGALAGLMHPLTGVDHILAMVAVGLWAAQLGGRVQWLLPASFVGFLAVGGMLGAGGAALPWTEAGIVTSVLLLGLLIGFAVKLPARPAALAVGAFALCHGYAHGVEMPASGSGLLYGVGFVAASAALHAAGLALGHGLGRGFGRAVQARVQSPRPWLRASGAAIAMAGVWLGLAA
ncbi:MAG: HupE/UreJ family protein [Duganella sp.]